jgi:Xaa-Pro aminopeptidase
VRAASPAQKAAMKKNLNAAIKDAKSARNEYGVWKKRLYKRELEIKRLRKSMAKNTAKLNAKLAKKSRGQQENGDKN